MKHLVITGAGSGIGQAVADRLHARGDKLYLLARTGESAERVARRYPTARTFTADLADPDELERAVPLDELPDKLDGLLHVAGVLRLGPIADLSPGAWRTSLTVNLAAPAELTRLLLPRLRHPGGHVVFVNSNSGLKTQRHWAAYSASKYGLRALADALRDEEAHTGLRVTTVYPGRTATPCRKTYTGTKNASTNPNAGSIRIRSPTRSSQRSIFRPTQRSAISPFAWAQVTASRVERSRQRL